MVVTGRHLSSGPVSLGTERARLICGREHFNVFKDASFVGFRSTARRSSGTVVLSEIDLLTEVSKALADFAGVVWILL